MLYLIKIPKRWDKDLAYLFGLLLGDGSLPETSSKRPNGKYQKRYQIQFFSNSILFLKKIYIPLFKKVFDLIPYISLVKNKINPLYNCRIESKLVYEEMKRLGYITGRKAKIAKIPNLPKKYWVNILAGLLDTDGGKKGNGFGLSTASKYLAKFCINVFKSEKIPFRSCPWEHKNHIYHQIYVRKRDMQKILKTIPIKNKEKINFIKSHSPQ